MRRTGVTLPFGADFEYIQRRRLDAGLKEPAWSLRWAVAKLVRHQPLELAFEGSSPSRPAIETPGMR